VVHAQAVLGADGFGYAPGPEGWEKIAQLGGVRIGDKVEIGACTTVDRGTLGHTVIADGAILDNLVQVAHNCVIGKNTAIAGCTGLAGSTIIGADCTLAGGVGVVGHVEICDNVHVTGMTMVTRSITEPGSYSSGTTMTGTRDWKRNAVRFSQLESIQKRLSALERKGKQPDKG
jgi:UDP-3-O-[3-hydroxymyristoyl] glucosamine N-acyltransferase